MTLEQTKKLEDFINTRYMRNILINKPDLLDFNKINVIYLNKISEKTPIISIVMPIFNQEEIIVDNLKSIIKHTTVFNYELILIIDCCSDNTENKVLEYMKENNYSSNLIKITILKSNIPLFETSADNLGFIISEGKYILEIQADMKMTETGYNVKLLKPFLKYDTVIGVSGRCCHNLTNNKGIGKLGYSIEQPLNNDIDKNAFYVAETCNRGPLMLDVSKLKELGYLDERNFYLDNSDHDLFCRAYYFKKWICGYIPIEFESELKNGSTRKPRDEINKKWLDIRKEMSKNNSGFIYKYLMSKPTSREIIKYTL